MRITVEFDTDALAATAKVDTAAADSWAADHFDSFVTAAIGWGAEYIGTLSLPAAPEPPPAAKAAEPPPLPDPASSVRTPASSSSTDETSPPAGSGSRAF